MADFLHLHSKIKSKPEFSRCSMHSAIFIAYLKDT